MEEIERTESENGNLIYKLAVKVRDYYQTDWFGLFVIMICYSLAGFSIVILKPYIFDFLNLTDAQTYIIVLCYPFVIIPTYYICLLFWGTILGKGSFFWSKILRRKKT